MVVIQRIVRSKGSSAATMTGKVTMVASLESLRAYTRNRKQVFAYLTEDGGHGIMRSGRKMRTVDMNVRNVRETVSK